MKVAVLGANGQLGSEVVGAFERNGDEVSALTHREIELASPDSVATVLGALKPELIVNTAAFHNVDKCEAEPGQAFTINALGPRLLAQYAQEHRATLMHVSTDYVFDGSKGAPYLETDSALPLNAYGNSKLAGENFVRAIADKHFVLRVAAIYGKRPCRAKSGLNFVQTMLKLARERGQVRVVDDEFTTPTYVPQIAMQMVALSRSGEFGLYHATAEGKCSWFEFADEIFRLTGTKVRLERAAPGEFAVKVPRPKYSVLENHALKAAGLNLFSPWQDGLRAYLT